MEPCDKQRAKDINYKPTVLMLQQPNFMWYNMLRTLKEGDYSFCMWMQVQESPCTEPIEDFASLWKTPPVLVAKLEIAQQEIDEYTEMCDNMIYHPMRTTSDHWPIGGINRMRQGIYSISQMYRLHANTGLKGGCNNGCSLGDSNPFTYIDSCDFSADGDKYKYKERDDTTPVGPCPDKRSLVDGNSYLIGPYDANTKQDLAKIQKQFYAPDSRPSWAAGGNIDDQDFAGTMQKDGTYFYNLARGPDSPELDYSTVLPGFNCPLKNDQAKLDALYE